MSFRNGSRGEWFVVVQAGLFLFLLFGPRHWNGFSPWNAPFDRLGSLAGLLFIAAGGLLALAGTFSLGRNLTPFPRPKTDAVLVVTGAYRFVRHPIYGGIFFLVFGWGLWLNSLLVIGYSLLFLLFFDMKSRYEERWLMERFPEYAGYRSRVRKLIPFIY